MLALIDQLREVKVSPVVTKQAVPDQQISNEIAHMPSVNGTSNRHSIAGHHAEWQEPRLAPVMRGDRGRGAVDVADTKLKFGTSPG
jgi:hypothetical protein